MIAENVEWLRQVGKTVVFSIKEAEEPVDGKSVITVYSQSLTAKIARIIVVESSDWLYSNWLMFESPLLLAGKGDYAATIKNIKIDENHALMASAEAGIYPISLVGRVVDLY